MGNIWRLKDQNRVDVYPLTHEKAVRDSNGTSLDTKLVNFVTKSVDDLVNYYVKADTYTKTEVQNLIAAIKQFSYEVVNALPTASASTMGKIYLTPSASSGTTNFKDEYITIEASGSYSWEQIGSTSVDLSGYVTTTTLNSTLSSYLNATATLEAIDDKNAIQTAQIQQLLNEKVGSDDIDNVVELTKAQYDALSAKDSRTMYIITDNTVQSDHVGVASIVQTTTSTADGGTNVVTCTLTNDVTTTFQIKNGNQGNSGYTGAAGELEVVNNLTDGGSTAALSAEMGKTLEGEISQLGLNFYKITISPITNFSMLADSIMRNTTLKFESTTAGYNHNVHYFPVVAGKTYKIEATNVKAAATTWSFVGFSTGVPSAGGVYTEVKAPTSTSFESFTLEYVAPDNGYLCMYYLGTNFSSAYTCTLIEKELLTDILEDAIGDEVTRATATEEAIDDAIYDTIIKTTPITRNVSGSSYHGIARSATGAFEDSSSTTVYSIYIPVVAGRTYKVKTSEGLPIPTTWTALIFSTSQPAANVVGTVIKAGDGTPTNIDETYTPATNGYLAVSANVTYDSLSGKVSFVESYTETETIKRLVTTEIEQNIGVDAAEVLQTTPPMSFRLGGTRMKSKTTTPTALVIGSQSSNYNGCIDEYINLQDSRETSKLIKVAEKDLDPHIGNFSSLSLTYWRNVIGVDSEGWIYVAQSRFASISPYTDSKILRTKDFVTYDVFRSGCHGLQLIEMDNGELCFACYETETIGGTPGTACNIYVTSAGKTVQTKKFALTQITNSNPATLYSWGIQSRGSVVAIGEYGAHGSCGCVWYSRDYGQNFCKVFDLRDKAPDVPHAHIHGVIVDPYFDRLYIVNGDGLPATTDALKWKNPRIWYWDYNGETLTDGLKDTISWQYIEVGLITELGGHLQFVCGYALKDCVVLASDSVNNGIFRINRGLKEETPTIDFGFHLGVEANYTKFCGGNMFQRNDNSPLFICMNREYSNDVPPGEADNPSNNPETYNAVRSRVYSTYDGIHFKEVWIDDTYNSYQVYYGDGTQVTKNLAKCGRDMSVWQLPNNHILMKYIGRDSTLTSYNNNGTTAQRNVYVPYCNDLVEFVIK